MGNVYKFNKYSWFQRLFGINLSPIGGTWEKIEEINGGNKKCQKKEK